MKRTGLTLTEVLVVCAILAILAGLLLPVLGAVREQGRAATCSSNARQLGLGFRLYLDDWERFPEAGFAGRAAGWVRCPADWVIDVEGGALWPYTRHAGIYRCPSLPRPLAFAMNAELGGVAEARLREPAALILLVEEDLRSVGGRDGPNDGAWLVPNAWDAVSMRHFGATTCLYGDGHARRVRAERFRRTWGAVPGEGFAP